MTVKVGVLATESSWHFQDLKRASDMLDGEVQLVSVDFPSLAAKVGFSTKATFSDRYQSLDAFDAIIVRTMPRGSLQQIVFRMDLLHRIAGAGVRVINSPRSVEIAIDKYLSLSLMAAENIPVPPFAVCQTLEQGMDAFRDLGSNAILKPIFGSMGKNLHHLTDEDQARNAMRSFVERGEVLYLQQFVDHGGNDVRILVVGNQAFSMKRVNPNGGWLTNISRGGIAEVHQATQIEIDLALRAAKANACQIAGVDIVYNAESRDPLVLEVNASPGWEAIQKVCEGSVANSVLKLAANIR